MNVFSYKPSVYCLNLSEITSTFKPNQSTDYIAMVTSIPRARSCDITS